MRRNPLLVVVCALLLATLRVPPAHARVVRLDADKIKVGLHTATPEEKGFVDRVVQAVDQQRLPASVVISTFQWARKRRTHKFQYFRVAMILRARKYHVDL